MYNYVYLTQIKYKFRVIKNKISKKNKITFCLRHYLKILIN